MAAVVRRSPFSDNPRVGARGQRTQQRILDAALRAFSEDGYHGCSVDGIAKLARCSRITFYQYFASKEDVFAQLAGQVARQVSASTETLDPLTPDLAGWRALLAWVARYAEIHARYEPVFHAYESDQSLAAMAWRTGEETVTRVGARLSATTLPSRQLDPVLALLLECLNHTLSVAALLGSYAPDAYPSERIERAITDVMHRTLFGFVDGVNVHSPDGLRPPSLRFGPALLDSLRGRPSTAPGDGALDALLAAGREVFIARGYHSTRVDDVVAEAGLSHGAFYRCVANKEELARLLTAQAVQTVGAAAVEIPDYVEVTGPSGKGVLRRWLQRYNAVHVGQSAMLQVWVNAAFQEPALRADSAPLLDWGRRRMAQYLQQRGFGDHDIEAVVMVGLLGVFGARRRPRAEVDATTHVIVRGLLGRET